MGSKHLPDGTVLTLFGSLEGETTYLCIDRLCPPRSARDGANSALIFGCLETRQMPHTQRNETRTAIC